MAIGEAGVQAPPGEQMTGRGKPRRRWVPWLVVLLMLALIGVGVWVIVWAHSYKGMDYGEFGAERPPTLKTITDGVSDTYLIDTGATGSTTSVAFSIANYGDHEITVEGLSMYSQPADVKWAPITLPTAHSSAIVEPTLRSARPFPARIGGGQQIMLFVLLTRPACQPTETLGLNQLELTWSALDVHHQFTIAFGTGDAPLPILTCYPKAALRHIDPDAS